MDSYKQLLKHTVSSISWETLDKERKDKLIAYLWDITKKAAQEDFYTFVKVMAPVLISGFKTGRHIEIISKELQKLYEAILNNNKNESKLQVFLPPESTKTVLCSHLFPAWILGKHPDWRIIAVAHSADHASKELGGNSKQILQFDEYQEIFPKTKISRDSPGAGFWKTTKRGYYFSGGYGTRFPGKRANLLLTDDMVNEQTVPSELKSINHNYSSGLESRLLEDNSGQLVVNTRWYVNDISGFLEERDGGITPMGVKSGGKSKRPWRIIRVPAILDKDALELYNNYPDLEYENSEIKYKLGGSYWPEHKSIENLLDRKRISTPHQWAALYLQNPIPLEGSIFSQKMFKLWPHSDPPEVANLIISLDTAFSERDTKDSAESVYEIWGIFPMKEVTSEGTESTKGNMILLGYEKGYWGFPELKQRCLSLYEEYGSVLDFFLIEDKASGKSLIQELRAVGLPVVEYQPEKDKISRAHSASALVHSGRVYLNPNLYFSQEFLSEVLKFPSGGKDTTDAFSQAVLWMRDSWHIIPQDYTFYSDPEDDVVFQRRPQTYWSSVAKH